MEAEQLREQARALGLDELAKTGRQKTLVRAIQRARGEDPCFLTDKRIGCGHEHCEWRSHCKKLTAGWLR